MENPKVSVLVPIYGVEKYIERCARSLFEQSLDNIEYIFVNDCTKDKSMDILYEVIKDYPHLLEQIRIINHETNRGLPQARKTGVFAANGEYIAHCDSDDWVSKDMYSILYNTAINENADVVVCDYYKSNRILSDAITENLPNDKQSIISNVLNHKCASAVWNKLVKRSLLIDNTFIYSSYNNGEDLVNTIQVYGFAKKIVWINKPLYYYFFNPTSITNTINEENIERNFKQACENAKLTINFINQHFGENIFRNDIIHLKSIKRDILLPLIYKKKYFNLWLNMFSEINKDIISCSQIPIKEKLRYLSIKMGIYNLITEIKQKKYKITSIFCLILYYIIARHLPSYGIINGKRLRYFCCKHIFKYCGKNVNIEKGAQFGSGKNIIIGDYSGIGINANIPNDIIIGNYVMMGPDCYILYHNHKFSETDTPMMFQGTTQGKPVTIDDDVWIGGRVIITPGRHIAKGSIIAAGCILTKDFPEYSIIGGNPSKIIKMRK